MKAAKSGAAGDSGDEPAQPTKKRKAGGKAEAAPDSAPSLKGAACCSRRRGGLQREGGQSGLSEGQKKPKAKAKALASPKAKAKVKGAAKAKGVAKTKAKPDAEGMEAEFPVPRAMRLRPRVVSLDLRS